jgi:hypothetical protein
MHIFEHPVTKLERSRFSNMFHQTLLKTDIFAFYRFWIRIDGSVGHEVGKLVEALCYKPEGRWFDSR